MVEVWQEVTERHLPSRLERRDGKHVHAVGSPVRRARKTYDYCERLRRVPAFCGNVAADVEEVLGLWDREIDFELPFPCRVINLKSGMEEHVSGNKFRIVVKQGETCWFRFVSRF